MPVSSRTPQRGRRSGRSAVLTGALLLALAGCSGDPTPTQPTAGPTAEPTPLDDYDIAGLTLVRGEFCDRVGEGAVGAALGDEPVDPDAWVPGARLPGTKDISNEFGCSWESGSVTARAWVFAPPITASRAGDFAREAVGRTCERLETAPRLGSPGAAQHCGETTSFSGLVGDTWVGCEISGLPVSGGDDTGRVGEWCVAVLEALRTA